MTMFLALPNNFFGSDIIPLDTPRELKKSLLKLKCISNSTSALIALINSILFLFIMEKNIDYDGTARLQRIFNLSLKLREEMIGLVLKILILFPRLME